MCKEQRAKISKVASYQVKSFLTANFSKSLPLFSYLLVFEISKKRKCRNKCFMTCYKINAIRWNSVERQSRCLWEIPLLRTITTFRYEAQQNQKTSENINEFKWKKFKFATPPICVKALISGAPILRRAKLSEYGWSRQ